MYSRLINLLFIILISALTIIVVPLVSAQSTAGAIGVLGDSSSDEYRADDNRGGAYSTVTFNWLEQLVKNRQLNFGEWGSWGDVRRTGYRYNFARSGATTGTLISQGQHTGLAPFVQNDSVKYVYISIGYNDFAQYNNTDGYAAIYNGTLSGTALDNKIQQMITNIQTAVSAIYSIGKAKIMISTIPNPQFVPAVVQAFPDAQKRQRVTDAIKRVNTGIIVIGQTKNIPIFDPEVEFNESIIQYVPLGYVPVGGEKILFSSGDEPHNAILGDTIHTGTVLGGMYANAFINKINSVWGTSIVPLTEQEILATAGIVGTITLTVTPTPPQNCSQKTLGDSDCSGKVDLTDFEIWRKEFTGSQTTKTADFNASGMVDIVDFEIWRKSFLK